MGVTLYYRRQSKYGHPKHKATQAAVGLMIETGEDADKFRSTAGTSRDGLFHYMPAAIQAPSLEGVYNPYYFLTPYDVNTTNVWTETNSGTGTSLTVQDESGGVAKVVNGSANNNYYNYQAKYEIWKPTLNKDFWFQCPIKIADVSECDLFVGMCAKLGSGNLFDNKVDAIGFHMADGSGSIYGVGLKDSASELTAALATLADDTWAWLGFHCVSTARIEFFVNGVWKATLTAEIPDDEELAVSFGIRNGTGSANSLTIGKIDTIQDKMA